VYTLVKKTAGSLRKISMGFHICSTATLEKLNWPWSISPWDLRFGLPVNCLSRWARRSKILDAEVSGIEMNIIRKIGAEPHRTSHNAQRQPSATTEKPDKRGPMAGAQKAAATHAVRA
jgi:hypothetical protein